MYNLLDAQKRFKRSNQLPTHQAIYNSAKYDVRLAINNAKARHTEKLISKLQDPSTNPKQFWSISKEIYGSKITSNIPTLVENGQNYNSPLEKADLLCEYFTSLSPAPIDDGQARLPPLHFSTHTPLSKLSISTDDVLKTLLHLNTSKSTGADKVSNRLLKETAHQIAPSLAAVFNKSLHLCKVPTKWKEAIITPIFQKGDTSAKTNNRPVSILSNVAKIMENVVYKKLYEYCTENGILTWINSGFKAKDSTINHMIFMMDKIYRDIERRNDVAIVYLDQSRAFDRIWHAGLIHKLKHMGFFTGSLLNWIADYLFNRNICVGIEGHTSPWFDITCSKKCIHHNNQQEKPTTKTCVNDEQCDSQKC